MKLTSFFGLVCMCVCVGGVLEFEKKKCYSMLKKEESGIRWGRPRPQTPWPGCLPACGPAAAPSPPPGSPRPGPAWGPCWPGPGARPPPPTGSACSWRPAAEPPWRPWVWRTQGNNKDITQSITHSIYSATFQGTQSALHGERHHTLSTTTTNLVWFWSMA